MLLAPLPHGGAVRLDDVVAHGSREAGPLAGKLAPEVDEISLQIVRTARWQHTAKCVPFPSLDCAGLECGRGVIKGKEEIKI